MKASSIFAVVLIASAVGIGTNAAASTPQSAADQAPNIGTVVGAGQVSAVRFEAADSAAKKEPRIRVAPVCPSCWMW